MKDRGGGPVLITGAFVVDAMGIVGEGDDAALLLERGGAGELATLVAAGPGAREHPLAARAARIDRPGSVLIPGLVNAHTHLDLTHLGARAYDPADGFMSWVDMVRAGRAQTPEEIAASVRRGVELSRAGGVVAVGDIAGAPRGVPTVTPWETARAMGMLGVSYLEFFGIGKGSERGISLVEALLEGVDVGGGPERMRLGLQPHAPNTVGLGVYQRAVKLARARGMLLSTHLAETTEEREFVAHARGPQREFLERLGLWEEAMLEEIGAERHPVEHLAPVLAEARFVVAHVNDADDAAIGTLARTGTSVVYCPRASAYFGATAAFGEHRYREMMGAGVRVALGTDSIINLDTPDRLSVLDEMAFLRRRDGVEARALLAMATTHGAAALGLPEAWFAFRMPGGYVAGVAAVEGDLDGGCWGVVGSGGAVELLVGPA